MYVFTYGTLRPGEPNYRLLAGQTIDEFTATANGVALLSGPGFPYAVPDPESKVIGTVCVIADDHAAAVLRRLDALEGYRPADLSGSHYVRQQWPVTYHGAGGQRRACAAWMYLAGASRFVAGLRRIPSGDWKTKMAAQRLNRRSIPWAKAWSTQASPEVIELIRHRAAELRVSQASLVDTAMRELLVLTDEEIYEVMGDHKHLTEEEREHLTRKST